MDVEIMVINCPLLVLPREGVLTGMGQQESVDADGSHSFRFKVKLLQE